MIPNSSFITLIILLISSSFDISHLTVITLILYFSSNSAKYGEVRSLSHVRPFATPWTVAHQAPLSMGFSRQEYWSGLPCIAPGDLPDPGIEPRSPTLQADALTSAAAAAAKLLPTSVGFSRQEYWSGLPFP